MARRRKRPAIVVERGSGPPLALDEVLEGADWPKRTWDLPPPGSPEYDATKRMIGNMRPAFPGARDGENITSAPG